MTREVKLAVLTIYENKNRDISKPKAIFVIFRTVKDLMKGRDSKNSYMNCPPQMITWRKFNSDHAKRILVKTEGEESIKKWNNAQLICKFVTFEQSTVQNKKTTNNFLIVALFTSRKVHFQTVKEAVRPIKWETKEFECQDMSTFNSILDDQKSDVRMMFNVFSISPSPGKK